MTRTGLAIATAILAAVMLSSAIMAGGTLPPEVELPIHWNIIGEPDRFADKWTALLMPTLLVVLCGFLFYFLPALEPRKRGLARSQGLYLWGWAGLLLVSATIQLAVLSAGLGWNMPVPRLIGGSIALLLILVGNQLGKSRSMYMVGIRTPWTLANEEVWVKTHRLAGRLMVAGGVATLAVVLLPLSGTVRALVLGIVIGTVVLVPIVYSFLLWRRTERPDEPQD